MKKISALYLSIVIVITSIFVVPFTAIAATKTLPTDVDTPSDNCVFLGIKGKYIVDTQNALDRINEIRKEACKEGVANPVNGKPLTMSDYVPIKWSSDLEYIARIRAAEASVTMAHTRTNLDDCFEIYSPNGISSFGEVLAWNFGTSVISGINQWYEEKVDWVGNTGGVTGHYTSMINPKNTYVGLGTFYTDFACFYNTTCGEFSSMSSLDETRGSAVNDCIQILEVDKSLLSGKYEISGASSLQVGKTAKYNLITDVNYDDYLFGKITTKGLYVLSDVSWSTSDSSVAVMNGNVLTVNKCGNVSVIAKDCTGKTIKKSVTIPHTYDNAKIKQADMKSDGRIYCKFCNECKIINKIGEIKLSATELAYKNSSTKPKVTVKDSKGNTISADNYELHYANQNATVGKTYVEVIFKGNYSGIKKLNYTVIPSGTTINSVTPATKGFTVKWKKNTTKTTGYEIEYSTDKSFKKGNKKIKISKAKTTSKKIKGLKANKKYYVRIRTYKKNSDKTYYSAWSKSKEVKTKK